MTPLRSILVRVLHKVCPECRRRQREDAEVAAVRDEAVRAVGQLIMLTLATQDQGSADGLS